jgi:Mrp family chromosome partitioning ATPase
MTIHVAYRAWTPQRAAAIVNAHVDSYRNLEVNAKVTAGERANAGLTEQEAELRKQLQDAETAVTRYRDEHHLTGAGKDSGAVSQQLVALNNQLIAARAELAETEARAARIGAGGESLPEVVNSGTMSALRGQEAQLASREADLSKYYGDEYPALRRVQASLQNLREQISREIGRDRAAALQLVERDRTRERSLQHSVTELTEQLNSSDAGLQQLQGKADSIRSVLHNFERRLGETAANPAFITPNSIVVSRANASATSTSPKAPALAFGGGFVGFALGSLLSLLIEIRDKTFRTSAQVGHQVGSPTVSATPRSLGRQRKSPADIILQDNASAFAEAFRVSWANMQLASEGPRVASFGRRRLGTAFGITSAASGEGKSTHVLALARTAALAGESVVLIDADLRRSGVSRLCDQELSFTLRDFLQDRCAASDVIAIEECSGIHFVPSTASDIPWTNRELQRFFNFVDYLKDRFAIVMIDLPPILGIAETIRLAAAADCVTLIIRWGRTERQFVQFALDALRSAGVSARTVILNDVDLRAQQRRGYHDSSAVYTHNDLYRPVQRNRRTTSRTPLSALSGIAGEEPQADQPVEQFRDLHRKRPHGMEHNPTAGATAAGSDIERLYETTQQLSVENHAPRKARKPPHRIRDRAKRCGQALITRAVAFEGIEFLRHQLAARRRNGESRGIRPVVVRSLVAAGILLTLGIVAFSSRHEIATLGEPWVRSRTVAPSGQEAPEAAARSGGPPTQAEWRASISGPPPTTLPASPAMAAPGHTGRAPEAPSSVASSPAPAEKHLTPPTTSPTTSPPATQSVRSQQPSAEIAALVARGDAFLSARDIVSARLFYERAADGGDGGAALRLGATFDPVFLSRTGVRGALGDPAQASSWYRRALDLGNPAAQEALIALEQQRVAASASPPQ